jgi:hypothetical protein
LLILFSFVGHSNSDAQEAGYTPASLFIALFSNGDALVEYDVRIQDPLADEIMIRLLAESSVANLIVVDDEDNVVDFDQGNTPNEIVLRTPGVSSVRISYTTQDLVDKTQGRWIFTLDSSPIGFVVKLPRGSYLTDPGTNFPSVVILENQQILTFKPGDVRFVYVIGVLGTEEQANIVIRLAETTISDTEQTHPGIVLANATDLLQKAKEARDDRRFPDAESLAFQANDAAVTAGTNYEAAELAIADAEAQIAQASSEGRDTSTAQGLLGTAKSDFAAGDYVQAKISAENAVSSIGAAPESPQMPIFVIVAAAVAAGGGIGAMLFLRSRKPKLAAVSRAVSREQNGGGNPLPNDVQDLEANSMNREVVDDGSVPEIPPSSSQGPTERLLDQTPVMPGMLPESQTDRTLLSRIVTKIVDEKPHLRPEDQDVLRYLAEKEGAAFESEIRTRFQLPKTTIWRLVKRLEREELVEIRKAGGQNLIKLKFESRLP